MPGALLLSAIQLAASPQSAQDPAAQRFTIHGSFGLRYRARWNGNTSDQDLAEALTLELGDAAHDPFTASISAEGRQDIDGLALGSSSSPYYELEDTHGDAFDEQLYHAYVDVHAASGWETLRLGRQTIVDTPETAWFDGLRAETREFGGARTRFGAYGGVPVQRYGSSADGSAVRRLRGGASLERRPRARRLVARRG